MELGGRAVVLLFNANYHTLHCTISSEPTTDQSCPASMVTSHEGNQGGPICSRMELSMNGDSTTYETGCEGTVEQQAGRS